MIADATNNKLMMMTIKMMAMMMMMMMMTLEHPGLPRATRPILNSIRMWEEVPHMTWKALLNMTMRN